MVINMQMEDEDALCIQYVCVLFPGRNSIPLTAANELWDVIGIKAALV